MHGSKDTPVFRQCLQLALSSIHRRVDLVFEWMLGSAILQPILPAYLIYATCKGILLLLCGDNPQLRHAPAIGGCRVLKQPGHGVS